MERFDRGVVGIRCIVSRFRRYTFIEFFFVIPSLWKYSTRLKSQKLVVSREYPEPVRFG